MIKEFLPQIKKAFSQLGVKIDGLRVSSSPHQRGASKQANSKTSSHLELSQKEETKTSKMSFPSGPMKVETPSIPNRPSFSSFHHVKDLDGLIDQLIQKLKVNLQAGKSEATVALKPDYLGHLQIRLTLDGKNILGKIMVDNPLAKNLIQTSLPQLKDSLTNLGIQVQDLDVFVGEKFPSPQKRSTSQGGKSQFPSSTRPILPVDPLDPLLGVNMAAQGGVDYLA
jgi:flagellar hook-length control protein FliK